MKLLQLGHLTLGRLRYVLSALAVSHADLSENRARSDRPAAERFSASFQLRRPQDQPAVGYPAIIEVPE